MDEVSVDTAIKLFIKKCDNEGPPFRNLLAGVPYSESDLRFHKKRIDWDGFIPFMKNVGQTWNIQQLEEIGREYARSYVTRAASIVGKILFSPKDFYKWACTKGHAPSTFTCVASKFIDMGKNRLQIILWMKDGYQPCKEFFYINTGVFSEVPKMIGYPESSVSMRLEGNSAVYDIEYIDNLNIAAFFRRIIRWPISIWSAGRELKETLESLQKSYVEVIEARNNLEKRVEERTEELKQTQAAKDRIFTNISHEFRTPLTLIRGPVEKLLSEEIREDVKEHYKMILKNTNRLLTLVNQLLDLSKLDSGKLQFNLRKIDLVELIKGRAASFESLAKQKEIDFLIITPDSPAIEWFNQDFIEKIVTNLLSNAFKFTNRGGKVSLSLKILTWNNNLISSIVNNNTSSPQVEIKVTDTGIGIHPDQLNKIFDRFYQLNDFHTGKQEGTGIGLSIVKDIVELCKGEISVESEPGNGSIFTVSLPLKVEQNNPDQNFEFGENIGVKEQKINVNHKIKKEKQNNGNISQLLIVEDNADMRKYIRMSLDDMYTICEAVNGVDGFDKAIKLNPDLIISDVMMPLKDGIEFCKIVKTNWETSHIPVILLTAKASNEEKLEGLETGADDYLTKPFDTKELFIRVRNLLDQRRLLKEKFSKEIKISPETITSNSIDNEFLKRAFSVAEKNLDNTEFDSEAFAKEMYLSRSQLHRKLQAVTGLSTGEFLRTFRLKHAAKMLLEKRYSVSEIAFRVGFNSPSYFTKAFRKQFNYLPSEFIEKA
jgi:signal transduction histidine kinase/DNA-binding response OmpR family regulator